MIGEEGQEDSEDKSRERGGTVDNRNIPVPGQEEVGGDTEQNDYEIIHGIMGTILPDIYKRVRKMDDPGGARTLYLSEDCGALSYLSAKGLRKNGVSAEAIVNDEAAMPAYIPLIDQPNYHALVSVEVSGRKYFIDPSYGQFLRVLGVRDLPDDIRPSLGGAAGGEYIVFPATDEGTKQVTDWMTDIVRMQTTRNRLQMPPNARSSALIPLSEMRELLLKNYTPANYQSGDEEWLGRVRQRIEDYATRYEQEKILESLGLPGEEDVRDLYNQWGVEVTPTSVILTKHHGNLRRIGRYSLLTDGRVMFDDFIIGENSDMSFLDPEDGEPVEDDVAREVLRILKKGEESELSNDATS